MVFGVEQLLDPPTSRVLALLHLNVVVPAQSHHRPWKPPTRSWGDLPSVQALQKMFDGLASGTDRSLDVSLQQHIDVIESMQIFFRRYFDETADTDAATSLSVTALAPVAERTSGINSPIPGSTTRTA